MKFLHAADIHLDSPLCGLSAYPDAPAERLRTATRSAFVRLIDTALAEQVDFLVIAGDLYDGGWKDFNTGLFFVRQMGRLQQAGIPVYLLHGNHDADSDMTSRLVLPENVHVFNSRKAQTFRIDALRVALHGHSFRTRETLDNLLPGYPAAVPGWLNIGVLHTALEGYSAHARYAPCSLAELQARGYQYWALGHVHEQQLWAYPDCTIAFPGNLQGRHVRETGARGALLVHADDDRITQVQPLELDVLRWAVLEVSVAEADTFEQAVRLVGQSLQQLLAALPDGHPAAVRVRLQGATAAHAALLARQSQLRQEVIGQAVALDADRLWIEKVQLASSPLERQALDDADWQDTLQELDQLMQVAAQDPDWLKQRADMVQQALGKVPNEVLQQEPDLAALLADTAAALPAWLTPSAELLQARLQQDDAGGQS